MMYGKNRVNNEIDNIDCDKDDEDAKRYATKYIKIVNDKLIFVDAMSDSIDKLKGLDVDTSNDIAVKKLKDFKSLIIKSNDKFNSYIKQDIKKKDIEKKGTNNSVKHVVKIDKPDNGLATSADIKAHIIDKRKLLEQRYKSLLETKKTIKSNIELIYKGVKKLPKESQPKLIELD